MASAPVVQAQARFDVLSRSTVPGVTGLTVYTIRDEQLSSCYLLFVMEPPPAATPPLLGPPPPADLPPLAADERRELDRRAPRAEQWASSPWSTLTPGEPTGGWEHMAESMRLALVDPTTARALAEPVTDKLADLDARLERIELLLRNTGAQQRMAVLPAPCHAPEPSRVK